MGSNIARLTLRNHAATAGPCSSGRPKKSISEWIRSRSSTNSLLPRPTTAGCCHSGRRMVRIEGETVVLRPFDADEIGPTVQAWTSFTDSVLPPGTVNPERLRKRLTRSGRFWRGFLDLAIEADGRLIGELQARRRPAQTLPPGAVELGIVIHDPADRGRGIGSEAVALLTGWLFRSGEAERAQL